LHIRLVVMEKRPQPVEMGPRTRAQIKIEHQGDSLEEVLARQARRTGFEKEQLV
jgi:hypothetical protein